ncbi:MAG: polysaccharide deacetylase family protein [Nostoc sp. EkiNYC01]|nr:polysaccharide deacetylase family protein [Nostoc sp. EkiNYC01]
MNNKHLKYQKSICVVISSLIANLLTACNTVPGVFLSSRTNQRADIPKVITVPINRIKNPINLQSSQLNKVENLTFTVPTKYQGKTVYHVQPNSSEKVIALTIDDGPWKNTTSQLLDILKENHIKATFFWVGQALQEQPDLAKREVAEGHAIGNHTWHHWYRQMDQATAKSEIERTANLIYQITGVKTSLFRPPGGFLNNGLAAYAKSQKDAVVMWSLTSADTDPHAKPQAFVNNVLKGAKSGAIVLMHDGGGNRQRTIQALPQIISGLKQQGYRFVTVPELLQIQS